MRMSMRVLALCAVAVFAFGAVACSDDDEDEDQSGGAESELCSDLAELRTALTQVDNLSASSTVDQAKQAHENVEKALDDVKSSARNVATARVDDLDDARAELKDSVDDTSGNQTLGSVATTIKTQAAQVAAARVALSQQVNCPG